MNGIVDFFSEYGFISLIVTLISAGAGVVFDRFLRDKLPRGFAESVPTVFAVIFELAADMLFVEKAFRFNAGALYGGLICGSLATALTAFCGKLFAGKITADDVCSLVSELLEGFIEGENRAEIAKSIVAAAKRCDENGLIEAITRLISDNCAVNAEDGELKELTASIVLLLQKYVKKK